MFVSFDKFLCLFEIWTKFSDPLKTLQVFTFDTYVLSFSLDIMLPDSSV